jgi:hypothetical protein
MVGSECRFMTIECRRRRYFHNPIDLTTVRIESRPDRAGAPSWFGYQGHAEGAML